MIQVTRIPRFRVAQTPNPTETPATGGGAGGVATLVAARRTRIAHEYAISMPPVASSIVLPRQETTETGH